MSKIADLQTAIVTRLTAVDPAIPAPVPANNHAIPWLTEDIGDLARKVATLIGSLGILGIVLTPAGRLIRAGQGPQLAVTSLIEIQIQENVLINRGSTGTQIAALDLVEFVMKRIHYFERDRQRIRRLELDEVPYLLVAETPTLIYNVRVNAPVSII